MRNTRPVTRKLRSICLALPLSGLAISSADAQDSLPMIGGAIAVENEQTARQNELATSLNELIELTRQTRSQIDAEQQQQSTDAPVSKNIAPAGEGRASPELHAQRTQSLDAIRDRIRLLRQLRLESSKVTGSSAPATGGDVYVSTRPPALVDSRTHSTTNSAAKSEEPLPDSSTPAAAAAGSGPPTSSRAGAVGLPPALGSSAHSETAAPVNDPQSSIPAARILPAAVDAFELGQSLYRTRNYAAALKALQSVPAEMLSSEDQTWLELLIALCQRRLDNSDKAVGRLREISNAAAKDQMITVARWWLKQTEATNDTQAYWDQISQDADALAERFKSHVSD
jgi:hypothetical protein